MYVPRVLRQIWGQRGPLPSSGSAAHSSMSDDRRVDTKVTAARTVKLS